MSTTSWQVRGGTVVVVSLTDAGRDLVLDEWARRLTVTVDVVRSPGTTFVPREGADVVVVVRLGAACVVLAPEPVLARLRGVASDLLVDVRAVTAGVSSLEPSPIGVATLGYRDIRRATPSILPTAPLWRSSRRGAEPTSGTRAGSRRCCPDG